MNKSLISAIALVGIAAGVAGCTAGGGDAARIAGILELRGGACFLR